jgi:2',3'-cyclic-nucleotide 2'-phosphodiesterase (5'-nucleotidase family)
MLRRLVFLFYIFAIVSCASKKAYLVRTDEKNANISENFGGTNVEVLKIIEPYKQKVDGRMKEVIGECTGELLKGKPHSTLTNFMSDAMVDFAREKYTDAKIDAGLMNYGGVRLPAVPKGPITVTTVFELMPFDNTLVLVKIDKTNALLLFDNIMKSEGWPVSRDIKIYGDSTRATKVLIGGRDLQELDSITLAMPSYVAEGGDNNAFLAKMPREDKGIFIRDLLEAYVRSRKIIEPNNEERIFILNEPK